MKKVIRKFIFFLIYLTGIPYLFREFFQKNKVTIILFHGISTSCAKNIFKFYNNNYNVISLRQYCKILMDNDSKTKLPKKSLVITFDDGAKNNYCILPMLEKYKMPVTIFLVTEIVGITTIQIIRMKN